MTKYIAIIGAGSAGKLLQRDILANYPHCNVLGFFDDLKKPRRDVLGPIDYLPEYMSAHRVDEIVVAIPSTDGALIRRILLANKDNQVPIKAVPRDQRIIRSSRVKYADLKALTFEDFLGRPIYKIDAARLEKYYTGKTTMVTGGAGSIGSEVVRQLLDLGAARVVIYDQSEAGCFHLGQQLHERGIKRERYELVVGSVIDQDRLKHTMAETAPAIVFHVAAYKHVHLMEHNVTTAFQNNVIGTKIVVDTAIALNVPQVTFVSTDKVVNPQSIMGATKKLAEYYIQSLSPPGTKLTIVRFGNVINSEGSVLPLFERQIREYKYVTVTDRNMQRYFMSIREAAQLIIQSTAWATHGEIYILDMGDLINIYEVAQCLIRSLGFRPGKDVVIKIIGRRAGEKLIEELFTHKEKEHLVKTKLAHVSRLKNREAAPTGLAETIDDFANVVTKQRGDTTMRRQLRKLFPALKPARPIAHR